MIQRNLPRTGLPDDINDEAHVLRRLQRKLHHASCRLPFIHAGPDGPAVAQHDGRVAREGVDVEAKGVADLGAEGQRGGGDVEFGVLGEIGGGDAAAGEGAGLGLVAWEGLEGKVEGEAEDGVVDEDGEVGDVRRVFERWRHEDAGDAGATGDVEVGVAGLGGAGASVVLAGVGD